MRQLIVNADDFGMTAKINAAIAEAHARGILTSASLMATGAAFEGAVALAQQHPRLGVGIHLNLTEGTPVSRFARVPSLVNAQGIFAVQPTALAFRILLGHVPLRELEGELRAQIEKVQAAGIRPTHLDGHKHVHMLPAIFPVVARLAREYAIGGVRCAAERPAYLAPLVRRNGGRAAAIVQQYAAGRALAAVAFGWGYRETLRRERRHAPRYFFGVTQTGFLDAETLGKILYNLPEGSSELMCHPGYADAELARRPTRLRLERERELDALVRPEMRELVRRMGIRLVRYDELTETV